MIANKSYGIIIVIYTIYIKYTINDILNKYIISDYIEVLYYNLYF